MNKQRLPNLARLQAGWSFLAASADQETDAGDYTYDHSGPTVEMSQSGVRCPYCEQPMKRATSGRINRVVWIAPRERQPREMAITRIPDTHHVLTCGTCAQAFTAPNHDEACR